jgi:hypothetical protein
MKKKPKTQLEVKKTKRSLKWTFTEAEITALGRELAEATGQATQLDAEKKQVVKEFDAKIAQVESQINLSTTKIQSGYEYRSVDCTETYGEPDASRKTVRRLDLNEIVEVRELSNDEKQRVLDFEKEQTEPKKEPALA